MRLTDYVLLNFRYFGFRLFMPFAVYFWSFGFSYGFGVFKLIVSILKKILDKWI